MSEEADEQKSKWILCIACDHLTKHVLRARFSLRRDQIDDHSEGVEMSNDGVVPFTVHRYSIWQCAGCTDPTLEFECAGLFHEGDQGCGDSDEFESENMLDQVYLPKRSREIQTIWAKAFRNLNPELTRLYREIIACFNSDSFLLCTIGLRALIEGICDDKGIDGKLKFERRIDELIKFLPSVNVIEALHDLRIAGNDAAHRLEALTPDKTREAIGIMEDLLNFLYDLDCKASQMNKTSKRSALKSAKPDSDSVQ